jgi:tripartite-type tricarboxylate transporter receptor subunit TctC
VAEKIIGEINAREEISMAQQVTGWFKCSLRQAQGLSLSKAKVQVFKFLGLLIFSIVELLNPLNLGPASAQQTSFYQGKTIRVIVGYQAGDSHDQWARTYTRYMGKYIPGNPNFLVQNMPGAGGMIAANYMYNVAKQDGLSLATIGGALYFAQLIGRAEAKFDWNKFTWIGTPERSGFLMFMRNDAPYKTLEDIRNASDPPRCSATGVGSSGYDIPRLLEETVGLRFKVISGYPGGADQDLAMERGEVQCRAFTIDAFFGREPFPTWVKKSFVRVILQMERKRHPKLQDVPTVWELMDQYKVPEAKRRLATVYLNSGLFGSRPIVSTPGLSAEQAKVLRDAYVKTIKDTEFLDEISKRGWTVDAVSGEELQALAKEVTSQPPEVIDWLKRLLTK